MPLTFGRDLGYDFDRMTYRFTMMNGGTEIPCGISSAAMDDHESAVDTKAHEREAQFARIRQIVEFIADRKFYLAQQSGETVGEIMIRTDDRRLLR